MLLISCEEWVLIAASPKFWSVELKTGILFVPVRFFTQLNRYSIKIMKYFIRVLIQGSAE